MFQVMLVRCLMFGDESCFDRQLLWVFKHENREEREREQKFKRLSCGEEVIPMGDWNLRADVKEQKQLPGMNWTGDVLRIPGPSSCLRKQMKNLSYSENMFGCCTIVCFS